MLEPAPLQKVQWFKYGNINAGLLMGQYDAKTRSLTLLFNTDLKTIY